MKVSVFLLISSVNFPAAELDQFSKSTLISNISKVIKAFEPENSLFHILEIYIAITKLHLMLPPRVPSDFAIRLSSFMVYETLKTVLILIILLYHLGQICLLT